MTKQEFLAMSLPYELKMLQSCEHWYTPEPNRVVLLTGIADVDGKAPMQYGNEPTETTIFYRLNKDITGTDYVLRFKPILRPLSDLTKPIEHKGERFVPIIELIKIKYSILLDLQDEDFSIYTDGYPRACYTTNAIWEIMINPDYLPNEEFWIIQKLIEWHFNLMDIGEEFIDLNTLEENPYK